MIGNITNLANIYLFARPNLRVYACSWYFIGLSVTRLLLLDTLDLSIPVISWISADYAVSNVTYCKIRSYLFSLSLILSHHFIFYFISIDRWLVTLISAWLRNQNSLKKSRVIIICSLLFWSAFETHALMRNYTNRYGCYPPSGTFYSLFASLDTIITTLLPSIGSSCL